MMKLTLPAGMALKAIEALAPFRSKDTARPVLTDLHIDLDGEMAKLVTTDSFRLGIVEIGGAAGDGPVDIPGTLVDRLVRLLPTLSYLDEIAITQEGEGNPDSPRRVTVAVDGVLMECTIDNNRRSVTFPDFNNILPDDSQPHCADPVSFNPAFVAPVRRFARVLGTYRGAPITIHNYGADKPAAFELVNPQYVARARMFLMPVKVSTA